ncbi:MAG: YbaB/EbfC family nucleoid-associated protein [Candidatus Riflebacteria bacterium]|nr:YbaB/EbfC family nucleoid-associated protein [Candidatus Riflebacteria bacterium]
MSMKDLNKLFKQAKKMQDEMMEQQSKLQTETYEASSGGGMVVVQVTGKMELTSVKIAKECIDPDDPDMLADLVKAAVNEALRKAQAAAEETLSSLTSGFKLPGM